MHAAISVSLALGLIKEKAAAPHLKALSQLPLPAMPEFRVEELIEIMLHDKRNDGKHVNCLLYEAPAQIKVQALSQEYCRHNYKNGLKKVPAQIKFDLF